MIIEALKELTSSLPGVNRSICRNEQFIYTYTCGSNRTVDNQVTLQWYFNGKTLNSTPFVTDDPIRCTELITYPGLPYRIIPVLTSNSVENGTRFESLYIVNALNENRQPFNITCEINGINNYTSYHKIESGIIILCGYHTITALYMIHAHFLDDQLE